MSNNKNNGNKITFQTTYNEDDYNLTNNNIQHQNNDNKGENFYLLLKRKSQKKEISKLN